MFFYLILKIILIFIKKIIFYKDANDFKLSEAEATINKFKKNLLK